MNRLVKTVVGCRITKRLVATNLSILLTVSSLSPFFVSKAMLNKDMILNSYNELSKDNMQEKLQEYKDVVKCSEDEIANIIKDDIDWGYMVHLDLAIGVVAENTNIISQFRFNNGFIESIALKKNKRQYRNDEGEGSANVMSILFPSPSGNLEIGNNITPRAVQMASLFGIIHKIRTRKIILPHEGIKEKIKSVETIGKSYTHQTTITVKEVNEYLTKKKSWLEENKKYKGLLKDKISTAFENIDVYEQIEEFVNSFAREQRDTVMTLLEELLTMINTQESQTDKITEDRPLPKYTAERMLLGYFVMRFNSMDDVTKFYTELRQQIKLDKDHLPEQIMTREKALSSIEKLHTVYKKSLNNTAIPYDVSPVSNGESKLIECLGSDRVTFTKRFFKDCAETSVRHVLNFSTYNSADQRFHLPGTPCDLSQADLDRVIAAIENEESIERKSLKERIYLYYMYQGKDKSNEGKVVTRSLWNYVMCNMMEGEDGLYDVVYNCQGNNEISSGIVNALKVYYNLAYTLLDGQGCKDAKVSIDNLIVMLEEKDFNKFSVKNAVEVAMSKVLKLFNPHYDVLSFVNGKIEKIEKSNYKKEWIDFFMDVEVNFVTEDQKGFRFHINQIPGHAYTCCTIKNTVRIKDKGLFENYDAALLYRYLNDGSGEENVNIQLNDFDKRYIEKKHNYNEMESGYLKRNSALQTYSSIVTYIDQGNFYSIIREFDFNVLEILDNIKTKGCDFLSHSVVSLLFETSYIIDRDVFFRWYFYAIYKRYPQLRVHEYEIKKSILLSNYIHVDNIVCSQEEISKENFEGIKLLKKEDLDRICYSEKGLSNALINNMNDEMFVEFLIHLKNNVPREFNMYMLRLIVVGINNEKWSKVCKILGKSSFFRSFSCDFKKKDKEYAFLVELINRGQIDLVCDYRDRFDFNEIVYWTSEEEYTMYQYIDQIIEDQEIKKKLNPYKELKEKILTREVSFNFNVIQKLCFNDLQQNLSGKCVLDRCITDLSEEDFSLMIELFFAIEKEKGEEDRFLIALVSKIKKEKRIDRVRSLIPYVNKKNYDIFMFVRDAGCSSLLCIIIDCEEEKILRDLVNRLMDNDCYFPERVVFYYEGQGYNLLEYALYSSDNENLIDIICPHKKIIDELKKTKSIKSIPKLTKAKEYFSCQFEESIMSVAIDCLNDEEFHVFLQMIPEECWEKDSLFERMIGVCEKKFHQYVLKLTTDILNYAIEQKKWSKLVEIFSHIFNEDIIKSDVDIYKKPILYKIQKEANAEVVHKIKAMLKGKGIKVIWTKTY